MIGPPPNQELKIFDRLPPANQDTFNSGLRAKTVTTEESLSIILYSPNLQLIGSQDNTGSTTSSTLSKKVERGFAFGMSEEWSITQSVGIDFLWVAAEISINFSMTFTQEWTTVETEAIDFHCPAGARVFAYQGTLMSRVLRLESSTGQFSWKTPESKTSTEVFLSHLTLLDLESISSDTVRIEQS